MPDGGLDVVKVWGVNCAVFATVSLADISLVLQILLLVATLCWTIFKAVASWRDLKEKPKEK